MISLDSLKFVSLDSVEPMSVVRTLSGGRYIVVLAGDDKKLLVNIEKKGKDKGKVFNVLKVGDVEGDGVILGSEKVLCSHSLNLVVSPGSVMIGDSPVNGSVSLNENGSKCLWFEDVEGKVKRSWLSLCETQNEELGKTKSKSKPRKPAEKEKFAFFLKWGLEDRDGNLVYKS